jgi:hypothetical protein
MEPLISIRIRDPHHHFRPAEELHCEYQLDAVEAGDVQAVEASVLWHTEGKGDEDLGVHHFERLVPADVDNGDLRALRTLTTTLPKAPLTYAGVTVKIRWCVRVRAFLRRGREVFFEQTFVLGDVPRAKLFAEDEPEPDEEHAAEDDQ